MNENLPTNEDQSRVYRKEKVTNISLKVASAAIFSALSMVVSIFTTEILPRVQWGLALFDPVSIIWILAFFVFGYEVGLLTSIIGMLLLMPFDPWVPLGPLMKFAATIPLIIIPLIVNYIRKKSLKSKDALKVTTLIINWVIAVVFRVIIMVVFNVIVINLMFGGDIFANAQTLAFIGLPGIDGWSAVIATVIILNIIQSIWDYIIPYIIVKTIFYRKLNIPW